VSFDGGGRQTNLFLEESAEQPKSVMVVVEITLIEIIKKYGKFSSLQSCYFSLLCLFHSDEQSGGAWWWWWRG